MGFSKFILNSIPRPWLIKLSYKVRPLVALALRGNQFTDPIEEKSYRKFLSYGYETTRKNVLAPGTFSLERHRLLWLYLQRETDFFVKPRKVLHVAPEQAFIKRFKSLEHLEYNTLDIESPIVDIIADLTDLPFVDNTFDMIICNHVLEHIPKDKLAMSEIYRVLKPGGMAILQVPLDTNRDITYSDDSITDPKQRARIFGQYDHVRIYGMDYYDTLASVGFQVKKEDFVNKLSQEEIEKYRLPANEIIPIATKPKA